MNLMEGQCVEDLADLLYNFLPGSGNSRLRWPELRPVNARILLGSVLKRLLKMR